MNKEDSSWRLDGKWKTNATKKYYPLTGKTELKTESDLGKSKLFPHLEELRLADDVAFYKNQTEIQKPVVIKNEAPVISKKQSAPTDQTLAIKKEPQPEKTTAISSSTTKAPEKKPEIPPAIEAKKADAAILISNPETETKKSVIKKEEISTQLDKIPVSATSSEILNIKSKTAANVSEIKIKDLNRWLKKSKKIQWDYKNIVKRKGKLIRLK